LSQRRTYTTASERAPTVIRNIKAITASSYVAMLFLGLASSLIGAAARNIGLTPSQIGVMIAVQNVGFGLSVWLSGALADTRPKPRLLMVGSLILGVSFLTFYLSPLFWLNLIIMFLIGVGIGSYEGTTDAMLFDLHEDRAPFYININHLFVTIGAMLIAIYLIFLQLNWRLSVVQSGVAVLCLAVFFAFVTLPPSKWKQPGYRERMRVLGNSRLVALLFIATILAVGSELGTVGVLSTFLADLRGFSEMASQMGLIVFLAGMAIGRLVIGTWTGVERVPRTVTVLFGSAAALLAVLYFVPLGVLTYVVVFLAGFAMSALLPLMLSYAGSRFREMSGTVMGTLKVAIPIGGALLPFVMSLMTGFSSFQAALVVYPLAMLAGFLLLLSATDRKRT
jgi:predicted MFS family arabinose efflux permease